MTLTTLKVWIDAARLRTLPLALSGLILTGFIVYSENNFNTNIFILTAVTILLLQILSNFANDYGDFKKGTDNRQRTGPQRTVQSGAISPKQMKNAIIITSGFAFFSGCSLLITVFKDIFNIYFFVFFASGIAAIAAAIKYTVGKNPFGYKGFGDIMVFLFFGIANIFGTYCLFTMQCNFTVLLPAISLGFFSVGVLNLNNMRDAINDKISGKNTLAVKFGSKGSKIYHFIIITVGLILLSVFVFIKTDFISTISLVIPYSLFFIHLNKIIKTDNPEKFDPELKRLSLSTLAISVWTGTLLIF
jgi:1,4-dihydroxy-2-naphthoate octaprenyltransferase